VRRRLRDGHPDRGADLRRLRRRIRGGRLHGGDGGANYSGTNDGGRWAWRTAIACDDGDACTYDDVCYLGSCIATDHPCTSTDCMISECDGAGGCVDTPEEDDVACGTTTCPPDECSAGSWLDYAPSCTEYCDGAGGCDDCTCAPVATACAVGAGNQCCAAACSDSGGCYTVTGSCGGGDVCTDPNTLSVGSVCTGCGLNDAVGTCGPSGTFECSATDNTLCESVNCGGTTYFCTEILGEWRWRPGDECDDGDACTYDDQCAGVGSCSGAAITCTSSADGCILRSCNGSSSCTVTNPSGNACVDSNLCTYDTTCDGAGVCAGGVTLDCNALDDQCANYSCDGDDTCAVSYFTSPCDDGDLCTYGEFCNGAGSCASGTTLSCDALDTDCVDYSCDGDSTCSSVINKGAPCDDGNAATTGDVCLSTGVCQGTSTCPLPINYTWDTTTEGWGAGDNWFWDDTEGVIFFYYDPEATDYQSLANSPELDLSACVPADLEWDVELDDFQNGAGDTDGSEVLYVLCSPDGSDWYILATYADGDDATDGSFTLTGETAVIPAICLTATAYIGFVAEGADTYNIDWWIIDNVQIYE